MKTNNFLQHLISGKTYLLLLAIPLLFATCKKHDPDLDTPLDPAAIRYEIIQDLEADPGGNTVILINQTPEVIPIWEYGTGRSTRQRDTIRFAFRGDYEIRFSAMAGGGITDMDPIQITVSEDNLNYVNDPLWIALSGGPGASKTWLLDIDQHFFDGPLYFYGTDNGWLEGGDDGCYGGDCWNWSPDYAGNSWIMPYGDYGRMTFSLIDGPYVEVSHTMVPGRNNERGTYNLDIANHTLSMSGAAPLHDADRDGCVANWGNIRIFSLTENTMQLGVLRRESCEGEAMLVYNYVTEDFANAQTESEE